MLAEVASGGSSTYLFWGQLVLKLLITLEGAELHGEHAILGSLDKWEIPILKINVVLSTVVVVHRDSLWLLSWPLASKGFILGVGTLTALLLGEAQDGVLSWICERVVSCVSLNKKEMFTYSLPCHDASSGT
jgi:hypothetical protein